jgi:hypothetical protein
VSSILGGTSGRFSAATYAARLFPARAATFIQKVKDEGVVPPSDLEPEPYPMDTLRNLSDLVVEFTTPPNNRGLGTDGYLNPSQHAISGIAVLDVSDPQSPNLSILRMRLEAKAEQMEHVLLRLNTECIWGKNGC